VFTSEDYGYTYAAELGCDHVSVDPDRATHTVSGTAVRADPEGHWPHLTPAVRAWFVRRFCVVGAESTGTTTLTRALADWYQAPWVEEYGRTYSQVKLDAGRFDEPWTVDEFVHIAQEQQRLEEHAARSATPGPHGALLFCDTDALATAIWLERYTGQTSPAVERLAVQGRYEHYFLTGDEIPFVQDGVRDGEHVRHWMHQRFQRRLSSMPTGHTELHGPHPARLAAARAVVETAPDRFRAAPRPVTTRVPIQ
jgi:NadR type nicotinamide-nucleotide adenylyltransferase